MVHLSRNIFLAGWETCCPFLLLGIMQQWPALYTETYVSPELLILVPVLYFIGMGLKKAGWFSDPLIPVSLGGIGVALSFPWVLSTSPLFGWQDALLAAFTAIVQGILCSDYINQLGKQATKFE